MRPRPTKNTDKIKQHKFILSQNQESKQTNNKSAITNHAGKENYVIDGEGTHPVARESR